MKSIVINDIKEKPLPSSLCELLPARLCRAVDELWTRRGLISSAEELRLHANKRAFLVLGGENIMTDVVLEQNEINSVVSKMCQGSLYAYGDTINQGYIVLKDGMRVGICGRAAYSEGKIIGVYDISSLCIRIPRRLYADGSYICSLLRNRSEGVRGVLIYSPPGEGKTTLLRSVAEKMSSGKDALRVCVVDTRGELGMSLTSPLLCVEILSGYSKKLGVEISARTLNAQLIVCDEIGDSSEASAICEAHGCGVPLVASAHASSVEELLARPGIAMLHRAGIFKYYVGIRRAESVKNTAAFYYELTERKNVDTIR